MMASVTKEVATVGTNEKRLFELERELTMAIISGKYKATILWNLGWKGPMRYGEIQRIFVNISNRMLTKQLRELETQKTEQENLQIIQLVRGLNMKPEEFAAFLRGGAFKPRTSPYDFQGLAATGLELLKIARQETGLPIVTEIMGTSALDLFADVDVIQVGARNMQNFDLLKELGKLRKPILLKRGLAATLKELLMSAEYIMAGGNEQIILCERGIRTFDDYTRNTLDLAAVPMLHELTHLPVIVDPSHSTGLARMVRPMALAAAACGTDGLIIEVHNDPMHALCDGAQSLNMDQFADVMKEVKRRAAFEGKITD